MPVTTAEDELALLHLLQDGDDSSNDDSGDESSDDESDSGSGDDSGDSDDDDSDTDDDESGSGSDDDDSDDDDSGSDSDSDDSSSSKKKKKKKGKKSNADEEKKDAEDLGPSAIFRIQQISSKLSFLLDDLHKTFKPKSVPKIDPKTVFPYPYAVIPQTSPQRGYNRHPLISDIGRHSAEQEEPLTQIHSAAHPKSPISSPLRHGNSVDRGAGGNFVFPSYAAPPTQSEIKKLYKNYSDGERLKIARNQKQNRARKAPLWRSGDFSKEFISASKQQQRRRETADPEIDGEAALDEVNMAPHTFDELYQHYDQQKRLIEQKQNKMQRMRNKLNWFKKNNADKRVSGKVLNIAEKQPLKKASARKSKQLFSSQTLKDRESNLLNKAAQLLMGNGSRSPPNDYDGVAVSPDSVQEKILCIASDEELELEEDVNRMPTFV